MASLMDWVWTLCRVGMFVGILPLQRDKENETRKVTFRFRSFAFSWSLFFIGGCIISSVAVVPSIDKYFGRFGGTLADRIGSYIIGIVGFWVTTTYISAQLLTARKIPGWLEELYEAWKELESVDKSTAASSSRRSFLFTMFCYGIFYLSDVTFAYFVVREYLQPAGVVSTAFMLIVEAGQLILFLFIILSCQVSLYLPTFTH